MHKLRILNFSPKDVNIHESYILATLTLKLRLEAFSEGANAPLGANLRGGFHSLKVGISRPTPAARPLLYQVKQAYNGKLDHLLSGPLSI